MADDVKEQSEHPYLRLLRERNRLARELARYDDAMLRHCKILSTRNVLDVLEICAVPIPKERKDMRVRDILRGCTVFAKQSASGSNHRLLWSLRESQE